jgi:hypothetical protein
MFTRPILMRIVLLATLLFGVGCGRVAERGGEEVAVAPAATAPGRTAAPLPAPSGPPVVENDAPAGICEGTANILSRVDRAPEAMFRAVAIDNRVGQNDGDGIRLVRFVVVGEGLEYVKDEVEAPFCILGGNEPDCGRWTRNEAGRYTWGAGGPVVQPGRYDVFVEVVGSAPDSVSGSDRCNWTFAMQITPRE